MTAPYKKIEDVEWEPHFMTDHGEIKWIYTREKDDSPITVMLIRFEDGVTLPDHVHRDQPDLVYVVQGGGTMFIDGMGEFPLEPGMVAQVPPNTKHAIRNTHDNLMIYNVFAPGTKYMKGGK